MTWKLLTLHGTKSFFSDLKKCPLSAFLKEYEIVVFQAKMLDCFCAWNFAAYLFGLCVNMVCKDSFSDDPLSS